MEGIFGIGITEILLVFVLALILLGPRDMVGTARKMGRWVNRVIRSPLWREIVTTSQELRDLPVKIVREAGMEETLEELKKTGQEVKNDIGGAVTEVRQAELDALAQARAAMHPEQAAEAADPQQDTGVNPPAEVATAESQAAPPAEAQDAELQSATPPPGPPALAAEITLTGSAQETPPPLAPTGELPRFNAMEPEQPDEYNI
jgi:sec-independent protein translocase protein TatB